MAKVTETLNELEGDAPANNLVVSGSFEDPIVPKGQYVNVRTGQSFLGWQVFGAGNASPISGEYTNSGIHFNAENGSQWLDITGYMSNKNCKPFVWTATANSILTKLNRLTSRISGTGH